MTTILHEMPYREAVSYVDVDHQIVQVMPHQIIVWVSLSIPSLVNLPVSFLRFPAILDTGNTFGFAISEKHLEQWSSLSLPRLEDLGPVTVNRVNLRRFAVAVWLHPNKKGERDVFRRGLPFRLDLRDGMAVYPRADDLQVPRLPILGLRAIDENHLKCFIDGERLRVTLRTPSRPRQAKQAGNA